MIICFRKIINIFQDRHRSENTIHIGTSYTYFLRSFGIVIGFRMAFSFAFFQQLI